MILLGIDLGGTNIRVGKIVDQNLIDVESLKINTFGTKDEIIWNVFQIIDKLFDKKIAGIGVGVPSVVDIDKGILYDAVNIPSWKKVPLKKILEKRYSVPVYINNDANCFAVGEKYFGKSKKYRNSIGLIIGTGLGAGLIINNKLYPGNNCGAGEFGMIPYKDRYLEYYCSGQFFRNIYHVDGQTLFKKASEGNRKAIKIFNEFGYHLGQAIKIILYSFDPEIIVLGGSVSESFKFFKDSMKSSIKNFAYPNSLKKLKITVTQKENIAILGAAALYLDAIT